MYFRNMEFAYDTVYMTDHAGPDEQLEKKIPGAGAAWEKNQEPEPEPLEKSQKVEPEPPKNYPATQTIMQSRQKLTLI